MDGAAALKKFLSLLKHQGVLFEWSEIQVILATLLDLVLDLDDPEHAILKIVYYLITFIIWSNSACIIGYLQLLSYKSIVNINIFFRKMRHLLCLYNSYKYNAKFSQ